MLRFRMIQGDVGQDRVWHQEYNYHKAIFNWLNIFLAVAVICFIVFLTNARESHHGRVCKLL